MSASSAVLAGWRSLRTLVVRVIEQYGEGRRVLLLRHGVREWRQPSPGRARSDRITPDRIAPVILRIGEALALAHSQGTRHHDIKPANILLIEQGQPLLTEFNIPWGGPPTRPEGPGPGALGTAVYAAPECLEYPQ